MMRQSKVGDTKLAKAIFAQRAASVWTIRQAARAADIDHSTYYRVESGKVPDLATFVKLAKWLGVAMEDLVG